jgi:hypothetical protein
MILQLGNYCEEGSTETNREGKIDCREIMQMGNGSTLNGQRLEKEDMKGRMHK